MWVDRLFDHVYVFGVVAVLIAAWGLSRLTRRRGWRIAVLVVAVLIAGLWALFGLLQSALGGPGPVVATTAAPSGDYKAVVRLAPLNIPDPVWIVYVQQTGSLTAREFVVGCINGDNPQYTFERVRWADPDHLVVQASRHSATVHVDPASGKPRPVSGELWNC